MSIFSFLNSFWLKLLERVSTLAVFVKNISEISFSFEFNMQSSSVQSSLDLPENPEFDNIAVTGKNAYMFNMLCALGHPRFSLFLLALKIMFIQMFYIGMNMDFKVFRDYQTSILKNSEKGKQSARTNSYIVHLMLVETRKFHKNSKKRLKLINKFCQWQDIYYSLHRRSEYMRRRTKKTACFFYILSNKTCV